MTDSPVPGSPRRAPLRKLAILFGLATDLAGTMISLWGVMIAAVIVATIQSGGNNPRNLMSGWATDSAYILTLMIIGIVWSVGGGFVAAKIAGREHVRHATVTGVAATILALLFAELRDGGVGITWAHVAGFLLTIPFAAAGGYVARLRPSTFALRATADKSR